MKATFLICPYQFCLANNMPRHCFSKRGFVGVMQIRQFDIQCVEFMKVAVLTNRRRGASIGRC